MGSITESPHEHREYLDPSGGGREKSRQGNRELIIAIVSILSSLAAFQVQDGLANLKRGQTRRNSFWAFSRQTYPTNEGLQRIKRQTIIFTSLVQVPFLSLARIQSSLALPVDVSEINSTGKPNEGPNESCSPQVSGNSIRLARREG